MVSQRCDLIKGIAHRANPVSVGYAFRCQPAIVGFRGTSQNECHTPVPLRRQRRQCMATGPTCSLGYVPKTWLSERAPIHLIEPGLARRRFARDLGARSSRAPLPAELVDCVQNPLRDWLYNAAKRRELCEPFSEFLLIDGDDGWGLLAILGEGQDADVAAEKFDQLFKQIDTKLDDFPFDKDASDVLRLDQLNAADYLTAHRLDLDRVTYGSRSTEAHSEPPS